MLWSRKMPEAHAARPARRYHQHCPVARSLDVVGERWTLLIVRDLLVGPKRFKELLTGSPGIGTNLLAARLRELEDLGLVKRTALPPPAASTVYELTEAGQALEPIIMAMGRWAMRFLAPPRETDVILPSAYFLGLRARFRPEAAAGLSETYELHIDDRVFQIRVQDGQCTTSEGMDLSAPDVVITTDIETLNDLLAGRLASTNALASGQVKLQGDVHALERMVRLFPLAHLRPAQEPGSPSRDDGVDRPGSAGVQRENRLR